MHLFTSQVREKVTFLKEVILRHFRVDISEVMNEREQGCTCCSKK
jgi:hypothetical protein